MEEQGHGYIQDASWFGALRTREIFFFQLWIILDVFLYFLLKITSEYNFEAKGRMKAGFASRSYPINRFFSHQKGISGDLIKISINHHQRNSRKNWKSQEKSSYYHKKEYLIQTEIEILRFLKGKLTKYEGKTPSGFTS